MIYLYFQTTTVGKKMNIEKIVKASGKTKEWALSYQIKTEKEALEAVKKNGYALQYVNEQTEAVCLEAVKKNGYALRFVNKQTEAVCLEAVKQDGYALKYVNFC